MSEQDAIKEAEETGRTTTPVVAPQVVKDPWPVPRPVPPPGGWDALAAALNEER